VAIVFSDNVVWKAYTFLFVDIVNDVSDMNSLSAVSVVHIVCAAQRVPLMFENPMPHTMVVLVDLVH
jgi:hypothetical protein